MARHDNDGDAVVLITGAGRRIGATVAATLHEAGLRVVIHHRGSGPEADLLAEELNALRADSARTVTADLLDLDALERVARDATAAFGRVDVLVNNASTYFPTPIGSATAANWDDLFGTNLRAPFFLAQALAPQLRQREGAIVNMADIYAERPIADHPIYCAAKAGVVAMTRSLALDLAPEVRVNAVAPGAILWPEAAGPGDTAHFEAMVERTPLQRMGEPHDIARTIRFLVIEAKFVTGQVIRVDGGRSVVSA